MKKIVIATLILVMTTVACSKDRELESLMYYSQLPAKFKVVNEWFKENPSTAPEPSGNTLIEIDEGRQFEEDYGIGRYYYKIDIADYLGGGVIYDVEFYIGEDLKIVAIIVNDVKVVMNVAYAVAESQLKKDYAVYSIGAITWSTQRGYQIGTFSIASKSRSEPQSITVWYAVTGEVATREMDSKNLGTTIPDKIKVAFEATQYSNTTLWRVEDIELDNSYNEGIENSYEVELQSIQDISLEAELIFSSSTGELLYSKEDMDSEDDSDDKFVVNAQLKSAVEAAVNGAQIVSAEIDNNQIEVDAIITRDGGVHEELELIFSMEYQLISKESEKHYTYGTLPSEFGVVKSWFEENSNLVSAPNQDVKVEIVEGEGSDSDQGIGKYYYEVEFDEYISDKVKYEIEFYLDVDMNIIAVFVNDLNTLMLQK